MKLLKTKKEEVDIESLNEVISSSKRILKLCEILFIVLLIAIGIYFLGKLKILNVIADLLKVISPVFLGLIIAWLFDPIVTKLEEKKIPRIVACIIVYLILFGIITLAIYLMLPSFISQIKDFVSAVPDVLKDLKKLINNIFKNINSINGLNLNNLKSQIFISIENIGKKLTTNGPNMLINGTKSVIGCMTSMILGIMIGFYMLFDFRKVSLSLCKIVPEKWKDNYKDLTGRINNSLRSYVQGVLLVMCIVFISQAIGLTIAGLKAPLIFALFCALTDVIPYFGPWIGAIPAVLVAFTISPLTGIFTVIAIVIVQLLENNFYQPLIMGHTMKLHPVTIMIGLLIFQHFFGILGMIIATPAIATLKVILTFINEKTNIINRIYKREIKEEIKE